MQPFLWNWGHSERNWPGKDPVGAQARNLCPLGRRGTFQEWLKFRWNGSNSITCAPSVSGVGGRRRGGGGGGLVLLGAVHGKAVVGAGKWLCRKSTIVMNIPRQPTSLCRGTLLIMEKT